MSVTLRLGVVGVGAVATRHISIVGKLAGAKVVAVCDVDAARAERAAAATGTTPYADFRRMFERERLDAVFVCTPPASHRAPTEAALALDLPVYVEKPIATTLEDARAIVDAWRASGAVCAVGYQWRGLDLLDDVQCALGAEPVSLLVSRSVQFGEVGRLESAAKASPDNPPWFLDRRAGGGVLLELASHDIDLQMALGGPVAAVRAAAGDVPLAQAGLPRTETYDTLSLILQFAGGGLGAIQVAWVSRDMAEYYALDVLAPGTALQLELDPEFTLRGRLRGRDIAKRATVPPLARTISRFLDAVAVGDTSGVFCTPEDASATLRVALACEAALNDRLAVSVPL